MYLAGIRVRDQYRRRESGLGQVSDDGQHGTRADATHRIAPG